MRPKIKTLRRMKIRDTAGYHKKTKSGVKKRFKISASGLVIRTQAGKRHNMRKRSARQIRNLRGTVALKSCDSKRFFKYFNLHLNG